MGVIMKRFDIMLLLVGLAVLNTACAEEKGDAKKTVVVAQNSATATKETTTVAMNTATKARETGTTRSAVDLMATPYRDAKQAGQLPTNTTVNILERRGGWLRISAQGKSGWARLHQVRAGEGPEAKNTGGGLAALKNVSQTGRSGSQGIVATTGIRGLSAEELKSAKPNPKGVESMEAYRANDNTAREFARSAGLKEKDVPFLNKE
jgi:hypothetical protein